MIHSNYAKMSVRKHLAFFLFNYLCNRNRWRHYQDKLK